MTSVFETRGAIMEAMGTNPWLCSNAAPRIARKDDDNRSHIMPKPSTERAMRRGDLADPAVSRRLVE